MGTPRMVWRVAALTLFTFGVLPWALAAPPQEAAAQKDQRPQLKYERERAQFRALLLSNPNYFGNLKTDAVKPVLPLQNDTTYEELKCVGCQPQFDRLDAVVYVKQPTGYLGGLCSNGSPEYVRFYLSFDGGATWQDQGLTSFTAYNTTTPKPIRYPLEYAATLKIDPKKRFCFSDPLLPLVRAILSWNNPPPPATPDFPPIWGNVLDARIQIEPRRHFILPELLTELTLKLPPKAELVLPPAASLESVEATALSLAELHQLYQGTDVPAHRYLAEPLQGLVSAAPAAAGPNLDLAVSLPAFGIALPPLVDAFLQTDGNTRYEELKCVGLEPNQAALVGVLTVKLEDGYLGELQKCRPGSKEYVAFWVDWGTGFQHVGTTSVTVHDIKRMAPMDLSYSLFLPIDLATKRRPCAEGPRTARVRAILSWHVPPDPTDPDFRPTWGNREETNVLIDPGTELPRGAPYLENVGGMEVAKINALGFANGASNVAGFRATNSPFGGMIRLAGHLGYPPDLSSGAAPFKYRIYLSSDGGSTWQRLTESFPIGRLQLLNGVWSTLSSLTQVPDADDWFEYREDLTGAVGNPMIFVNQNTLGRWSTGSGMTGLWKIRLEVKDPLTSSVIPGTQVVATRLDNANPKATITITSGGGSCADFTIGSVISGSYAVTDEHFGSLALSVLPGLGGGSFTAPTPLPREYPLVPSAGDSGTWSLNTAGMTKCGYVVHLYASDRTIVNSGGIGWDTSADVGLCLR